MAPPESICDRSRISDTRLRPQADAASPGAGILTGDGGDRVRTGSTPDIISSDKVLRFYRLWLSRCNGGRLPKKSDMDPIEMRAFLSSIVLTKVHYDPLDFEYRIIGEDVIARLGNMTGKRVRRSALIDASSSAYQNYCAVVESRAPQFLEGMAVTAFRRDRPYLLSRVHCPLSSDGETIDYVISCLTFL